MSAFVNNKTCMWKTVSVDALEERIRIVPECIGNTDAAFYLPFGAIHGACPFCGRDVSIKNNRENITWSFSD